MGVGAKEVSRGMTVPFCSVPIQNGLLICDVGQYGRRNRKLPYLQTAEPVPSATLLPNTQHNSQADCYSQQCISQPVYATCGMVVHARTVVQFPYIETCGLLQAVLRHGMLVKNHYQWLDSPWWALAFLRSFAHSSLWRATFFQFLTTNILTS